MVILTRQELELRAQTEKVNRARYEASQDLYGNVTCRRPPSIEERIYTVVCEAGGAVTRSDIARLLNLRKTPWLVWHIEELVTEGTLVRMETAWKNGVLMYLYVLGGPDVERNNRG